MHHARNTAAALVLFTFGGTGCDRIKSMTGGGSAEGGAAASGGTTSGGSGLSFLTGNKFEGEITMDVSGKPGQKGGPKTLTFGLKSPKVRIDGVGDVQENNPIVSQGASFIIDPPQKKGFILIPAKKQALALDFDKARSIRLPAGHGGPSAPSVPQEPPKVEKTGKKDVIAGYECEEWKVTSKDSRAEVCAAEGITWIDLADVMQWPELSVAAVASEMNHFPLRIVTFDAKNQETARLTAKKIDKKSLDDSRFVVPPDYQVTDMSAILGAISSGKLPPGIPPPKRQR